MRNRLLQPWFGGGVGSVLAILFGLVLLLFPVGKGFQTWSYDLPFLARPEMHNPNIVIIYLDERSYAQLGQDPADFDRNLHAKLIRKLKAAGAKMVVFDILFIDSKRASRESDVELSSAMREHGKVIIGAQYHSDEHLNIPSSMVWPPIDILRDACAGWGLALIHRDSDFGARLHHSGTAQVQSLSWRSAEVYGAEITKTPNTRQQERWLNYYSHEPFEGVSYCDALSDGPMPAGFSFKNKVVFIGSGDVASYGGDQKEQFRSPWTWMNGHFHLGVEVHAVTFCNLIQRDWLWRIPYELEVLTVIASGLLLGYGLCLFRPLIATIITFVFVTIVVGTTLLVFQRFNLWFPWLILVAGQAPLALLWSYLFHSIESYLETKILRSSLEMYLSPHQVHQIIREPQLLKPGASQKTVSILFSDIASFSKISERMDSKDLVNLLNNYYEVAIECVHSTDGTVMNLIGDAIFAIWNAPQEQSDHNERCCRAALRLNQKLINFNATSGTLPLRTRIGLHTGVVSVGNIGSSKRFEYTAIGESVNMASRLEGLNKQLGTAILATREIQRTVEGRLVTRPVGHFRFKGFDQVVEIYEIISEIESKDTSNAWRLSFQSALSHFQRKEFQEAHDGFGQTLSLHPGDGPSKFYIKNIEELKDQNLSQEWIGEIDLRDK